MWGRIEKIYYHYNLSKSYNHLIKNISSDNVKYNIYLKEQLKETLLKKRLRGQIRFDQIPLIDMLNSKYNFSGQSILCVGCRNTDEIKYFKKKGASDVVGIDLYHISSDVIVMDMHELKFEDESFDVVYSRHSFEHAFDKNKAATEFIRVLKPGGVVVIEVPGKYKGGGDYNYFNTIEDVTNVFKPHVDQFLWKEYSLKEENNDKMDIIRVMFSIQK